jgi:hypothetical protein
MGFKDDNTQSRICNHHPETCTCRDWDITEEPKQLIGEKVMPLDNDNIEEEEETLKEAKIRIRRANYVTANDGDIFEMGVEWQAERMYSEEEVKNIAEWAFSFHRRNDLTDSELEDEFERILNKQFKKK